MTSARSVAQIASSAKIQSGKEINFGKASLQAWAKSLPVEIARRAHSDCKIIAMMFESTAINKSV